VPKVAAGWYRGSASQGEVLEAVLEVFKAVAGLRQVATELGLPRSGCWDGSDS
jgi:hypothetical protein